MSTTMLATREIELEVMIGGQTHILIEGSLRL